MRTVAEVVEALRGAEIRWSTAQGRTRWWRRQDLVIKAFTAEAERVKTGSGGQGRAMMSARSTDPEALRSERETVLELAVRRSPWQLRAELVSAVGLETRADLLVVDGDSFWARTGDRTTTNGGDPSMGHGGGDIAKLLTPHAVPEHFDLDLAGSDVVAGRACTTVEARLPLQDDPNNNLHLAFPMISGGRVFLLSIDDECGVLLRVVKIVDDAEAEITEFQQLTLNPDLATSLFDPLPDAEQIVPFLPGAEPH